jgi:toxin-antitoxin system PIN domain toxin
VTPFLLDVNVLVALTRRRHSHHEKAMRWYKAKGARQWATCPLTEAGFVRTVSNPKFAAQAVDMEEALRMLAALYEVPGHQFWPIDFGLKEAAELFEQRLLGHQQLTDAYLLALAVRHQGKFVTLDQGIQFLAGNEFAQHVVQL